MTIGERLKEERQRLGMSQSAMGVLASVTKMSQINYEKGTRSPDAPYLAAIAVVGADVLYIVTGVRAPVPGTELIAAEDRATYGNTLAPGEAALLDNYRHSSEEAQAALRATSAALAQYDKLKNRKGEK